MKTIKEKDFIKAEILVGDKYVECNSIDKLMNYLCPQKLEKDEIYKMTSKLIEKLEE